MSLKPWWRRPGMLAAALAAVCAAAAGAAPPAARGEESPQCPGSPDGAYAMAVGALTGPAATDLSMHFTAAVGCGAVTEVKHVQINVFREDGTLAVVRNLRDVEAPDGSATVALDRVEQGRIIEIQSHVQTGSPRRTYVLRASTTSLLRPDLVVTSVDAPLQTLATRPVDVVAEIAEVKGDTAARVHVALGNGIAPLADPIEVTVPAGGNVAVTFPSVALTSVDTTELEVIVTDSAPEQYDTSNDTRQATVEVTSNELMPLNVLVPSLGGYGFQFNQHLYAPITNPAPATLPDLESKVKALEPQLVRIFYNDNWEANGDRTHPEFLQNLQSFKDVVKMANDSGATVVIAYQTVANAKLNPTLSMGRFADVLQDLVVTEGFSNVRWALVGNEPNSIAANLFSKDQYKALYVALHQALVARGLRGVPGVEDKIRLIGGDLLQNTEGTSGGHRAWFDYMTSNMADLVDGWSEHIYWNYNDHFRMEERLKDVSYLVHTELAPDQRKPTFVLEYGVRGFDTCGDQTLKFAFYRTSTGCLDLRRTTLAAFHKLWFSVVSAQLGFAGASNWDLYWSVYDKSNPPNQSFWTMAPTEGGWELYPSYYALQLLHQTTGQGWQVLAVDPVTDDDGPTRFDDPHADQLEQELTAYSGPAGQLTVLGLDTSGGSLVEPNGKSSSYSIGGLPPFTTFTLAVWNANGDGTNSVAGTITTSAAGVARFDVPLQAAFALTTVPVS